MEETMKVINIDSEKLLRNSYPIMNQLRINLSIDEYLELVKKMKKDGYQIIALVDNDDNMFSLAGFRVSTNLYYGKHIWVYDLITDSNHRSKGYGEILLKYLLDYGKKRGCKCIALSSGLERIKAHKFYEKKVEYNKVSFVYKKDIT